MDTGLSEKTVIITGATANIGRAIALGFAGEGARIIAVGRDEEAGKRLISAALEGGAAAALFVREDMLDKTAPARILATAQTLGPVDVLVNNVGGNVGAGFFVDSDPDTWGGDLDLNLGTTLRMTHAVLPGMIAQQQGVIINIGSTAGIVGDYMLPLYSAAKSAVHGFTAVLAKEVGQHNIRVNAVAPYGTMARDPAAFSTGSRFHPDNGFFKTAYANTAPADMAKRARKTVLESPVATPEQVASAVVYLASDGAGFMTGQVVRVDGGSLL